jgi:hypothetical protein
MDDTANDNPGRKRVRRMTHISEAAAQAIREAKAAKDARYMDDMDIPVEARKRPRGVR